MAGKRFGDDREVTSRSTRAGGSPLVVAALAAVSIGLVAVAWFLLGGVAAIVVPLVALAVFWVGFRYVG